MANAFERAGVPFRSVSGYLKEERAWTKINNWIQAAGIRGILRNARHGIMGHLYPGMLDVSTDMTMVSTHFGGHMEVLEFDDLRVRVEKVTEGEINSVLDETREIFDIHDTVVKEDLRWAGKVAVGLRQLVTDFDISSLAYYHRGLDDEIHERLGAGMILGCSLLTAEGVPAVGEYELRTSIGMLMLDRMGAGGSFTEFQALNFNAGVVEMGHDGPAHLAISNGRPILRGLGVYHGKRGNGVSVEFDVAHGPVTVFGVTQRKNGTYQFVASEGAVVEGPRLKIGNTTSLVDFGVNPGQWCDAWSATGVPHHWALGIGHRVAELKSVAELLDIEMVVV
jgi:L-arabinose isomerase